jgi:hypothetical protein
MATKNADSLQNPPFHGEQGNLSVWKGDYQKAGVASGDILRLCIIPAGADVTDMDLVHDACGASVTAKLGYSPVNSADCPTEDDDYWLAAGQDISSAGRIRSAAHAKRFEYDVYVILTIAGAAFDGTDKEAAIAKGEYQGVK